MKRVLILLLLVLVAGCADTGPDSDWECPSCHWGIGEVSSECPNCGDEFVPRVYRREGGTGHIPVKREK
jgi:hypothetical protein